MAKLDHPFIVKMMSHWKDDDKLYMLLTMYQGGELQSVIHTDSRDGVPEWAAKFYAANILEGLTFMHRRLVIGIVQSDKKQIRMLTIFFFPPT